MKFRYAVLAVALVVIVAGLSTRTNVPAKGTPPANEVWLNVPAVDSEGNGVTTVLKVGVKPGNGRVLVDVNQLVFWADTQYSIQTARNVAKQVAGVDMSGIDLTYSIETNASLIEGPSAGAALAVATIAALGNKTLNSSVMITGTINSDGTIGDVGAVSAKASVAKDAGATLFLVPQGQGVATNYVPEQKCEQVASVTICTTVYKPSTETGEMGGIRVVEVSDIRDALKYFGL